MDRRPNRHGYDNRRNPGQGSFHRGGGWRQRYNKPGRTAPIQQKPARPMPIGDRCNPLCPFFRCLKNAKMVMNKFYRGRSIKVAYCRLFGGECIGASCKYASCKINAMLPDGRCAKALKFKTQQYTDEDLEREARELEDYDVEEFS